MRLLGTSLVWLAFGIALCLPAYLPTQAQAALPAQTDPAYKAARKVAFLRQKADDLAQQLKEAQSAGQSRLAALQKQLWLRKQEQAEQKIRLATWQQATRAQTTQTQASQQDMHLWLEALQDAIQTAYAHIQNGLPAAQTKRQALLAKAQNALTQTPANPSLALRQLWRFLEQETKLGQSCEVLQQKIQLADGSVRYMRAGRIAMAAMVALGQDGTVAWSKPSPKTPRFALHTPDPTHKAQQTNLQKTIQNTINQLENAPHTGRIVLPTMVLPAIALSPQKQK